MIGIDTNVLIRLLTKDNEAQYQVAHGLFKGNRIFITDTVFLESEWVLRFSYNYDVELINDALTRVLGLPNVITADSANLYTALQCHHQGMDFADALHSINAQGDAFYTFDQRFSKKAKSTGLLSTVVLLK